MRRQTILAVDLGTTRIKFGLLSNAGDFMVVDAAPAPIAHPEPGATVQHPDRVIRICLEGLKRCAAAQHPQALVLTGQMGGAIVVDRGGAALTPWLTNMDNRCRPAALALRKEIGARLWRLTASAPEQAQYLRWLRQTGQVADSTSLALLLAPFVAIQLSRDGLAAAYCDRTCTGWSGLADVVAGAWDDELARAAFWSTEQLPAIVEPGATVGYLAPAVAAATGLPDGLPIIAGPGDQAASLYALGAVTPGDVVDSASTFPLLAGVTNQFFVPTNDRVEVMPGVPHGTWHPLGGLLGSGAMPAWYAETLSASTLAELEREADEAGDSAGVLAMPYGAMGASRGIFWGLDPSHRRGHLYRAVLEGIAFEYALLIENLEAEGVEMRPPILSYGGGSASLLLRRIKANVLGMPLRCLSGEELTLMGAALLAARRLGWTIDLPIPNGELVQPDTAAVQSYRASLETYRRVRRAVTRVMDESIFAM